MYGTMAIKPVPDWKVPLVIFIINSAGSASLTIPPPALAYATLPVPHVKILCGKESSSVLSVYPNSERGGLKGRGTTVDPVVVDDLFNPNDTEQPTD